jgi:predicted DNA-binding protein with PD1-like motif
MRWKEIVGEPKVFALILKTGYGIANPLEQFAKHRGRGGSSFKAIGALSDAKLGWFNWEAKKYDPACVLDRQVELLSLAGAIASSRERRKCTRTWLGDAPTRRPTVAASLRLACARPANGF